MGALLVIEYRHFRGSFPTDGRGIYTECGGRQLSNRKGREREAAGGGGGGGRDGRPHPGGGGMAGERNNTGCIGGAGRVRFNWFGLLGLTALATLRRSYRGQWRSQVFLLVVVRTPPRQ